MKRSARQRAPASLEDVLAYRCPDVLRRFRKLFDVSPTEAAALFREVKKLLWLTARQHARGREAPTLFGCQAMMDEMWHNFVLFAEEYERFCVRFFGHVIKHHPETRRRRLPAAEHDRLLDYNIELVY